MSQHTGQNTAALPFAAPAGPTLRMLLFAIRRMAIHGLNDTHASHALLCHFGQQYRRPQLLLRALLFEMARCSRTPIHMAPGCCWRMTADEAMILEGVCLTESDREQALALFSACLDTADCIAVLSAAQAVNQAFGDLGRPLARSSIVRP